MKLARLYVMTLKQRKRIMNKKFLKYALTLAMIFMLSAGVQTNHAVFAQKIGHSNSIEILEAMPEYKAAQTTWETYYKKKDEAIKAKGEALQKEYNYLIEHQKDFTPQQLEEKMAKIQEGMAKLDEERVKAQQDVVKKEQELTKPILEKIKSVIESVAKENGYTYILDSASGMILFGAESNDVTNLIKAKL